MASTSFEFVAHEAQHGAWFAWPWEFAYIIGKGDSKDKAISDAKSSLDRELDRREAINAQYKFKPGQCPPPLKQIRERVQQDAQRRKLPYALRSYSDWLNSNPIDLPGRCLRLHATDSEIATVLREWGDLICVGKHDEAFQMIPDANSILPNSDFPQSQLHWTADMLQSMLDDAGVQPPINRVDVSGPSVTRVNRPKSPCEIGQRLVCGLGEVDVVIAYSIALPTPEHVLEIEIHGFVTDQGILPTLRRLSVG